MSRHLSSSTALESIRNSTLWAQLQPINKQLNVISWSCMQVTITTTENVVVVVVVVWRSHANRFSSFFSLTRVEKGIKRKFHSVLYTVRIVGSGTGSFSLSLSELISMSLAFWMESPKEKETSKQEEEEEEDQNDGQQGWMNRKHANPSKRLNPECLQQPQRKKNREKRMNRKKKRKGLELVCRAWSSKL